MRSALEVASASNGSNSFTAVYSEGPELSFQTTILRHLHQNRPAQSLTQVPRRKYYSTRSAGDPLDDVADDVRYGLYTFINASEKPRELRIREALKPLAEVQDMTSAYVRWQQVTAEPQYRPATFGRYSRRRW